jgi:hypothetical protein
MDKTNKECISLQSLLDYAHGQSRVCPMPDAWMRLWKMLPDYDLVDPPLILGAWRDTPHLLKRVVFDGHLEYADKNGILGKVSEFLLSLPDDQWLYSNN